MQTREIQLSEIFSIFEIFKIINEEITYSDFEDAIYQMNKEYYKFHGIYENEKIIAFCITRLSYNLKYKRYLHVDELYIMDQYCNQQYYNEILNYLIDYAKINLCKSLNISTPNKEENMIRVMLKENFAKEGKYKETYTRIL